MLTKNFICPQNQTLNVENRIFLQLDEKLKWSEAVYSSTGDALSCAKWFPKSVQISPYQFMIVGSADRLRNCTLIDTKEKTVSPL